MLVLKAKNVSIEFGGLKAVTDFNLLLNKGELVGLIGPNGAGKTTVFNLLTGVYKPTIGQIFLNIGENDNKELKLINKLKSYQVTQFGIARTFQNIRLFKDMSVIDNVKVAIHFNVKYSMLSSIFRTENFYLEELAINEQALKLLEIFNLHDKANEFAKNLSYGDQRKLEIARALATRPKVLLLDEPAAGMNPQETFELMGLIELIKQKYNLTILLIEHDMNFVMGICQRIIVLDYGETIAVGDPKEIRSNPTVIKAYLGEEVKI